MLEIVRKRWEKDERWKKKRERQSGRRRMNYGKTEKENTEELNQKKKNDI